MIHARELSWVASQYQVRLTDNQQASNHCYDTSVTLGKVNPSLGCGFELVAHLDQRAAPQSMNRVALSPALASPLRTASTRSQQQHGTWLGHLRAGVHVYPCQGYAESHAARAECNAR
jgi:hypothetical protein